MSRGVIWVLMVGLMSGLCAPAVLAVDKLIMVYRPTEKSPYIQASPENVGVYRLVFEEAARRIGLQLEIQRLPKKRAYAYLESGKVDFYPGASFNEDREKIGFFIDNCMAPEGVMLLARPGLTIRTIDDVKGHNLLYNMGGTTSFYKMAGVDVKANTLREVSKLGIGKAVKILKANQADVYAYDLTAVRSYLKLNPTKFIVQKPIILKDQVDHLLFSKKSKYYKEVRNPKYDERMPLAIDNLPYRLDKNCLAYKFQITIKAMKTAGEIEKIFQEELKRLAPGE